MEMLNILYIKINKSYKKANSQSIFLKNKCFSKNIFKTFIKNEFKYNMENHSKTIEKQKYFDIRLNKFRIKYA